MLKWPNITALIIDGDITTRILIQRYLEKSNHEIWEASNGEEALEQMKLKKPDLILWDVMALRMTSSPWHEILQKMKEKIGDVPVVIMSSREDERDLLRSWPVASFLKKPFTKNSLLKAAETAIRARGESLQKILVIDNDLNAHNLFKAYLEVDFHLIHVMDGKEALKKVVQEKPDIILMDVATPTMMGAPFQEELKKTKGIFANIPVVVINSSPAMKYVFNASETSFFLKKPFTREELKESILHVLKMKQSKVSSLVERFEPKALAPCSNSLVLISGMDDYAVEAIKSFLESRNFTVETGLDEAEVLKIAAEKNPFLILCQFWEEPEMFDAVSISTKLSENPQTKGIPFAVYCIPALSIDASKCFSSGRIMSYTGKRDLLRKLELMVKTLINLDETMKKAA